MTLPSDELLLAAFAKGDRQAFDRLTSRYSAELDAFFRRRLPDDGRVEELRQETLLALYALLPSYQEKGRFRSLLFAMPIASSSRRAGKSARPPSCRQIFQPPAATRWSLRFTLPSRRFRRDCEKRSC